MLLPRSRENELSEEILCLSIDGRWHQISDYFVIDAAKNTIRKYLTKLAAKSFLTAHSWDAPKHYQPRQQYQITEDGCHEAIRISYRNKHPHMNPRSAERFIKKLTHQLEFYEARIARLQKRMKTDIIHQDSAVHITHVDERMDAFREQNADLRRRMRSV